MISIADMKSNNWYNQFLEAEGKDPSKITDEELQGLAEKFETFLIEKSSDPHVSSPQDEERSLSPEVAERFCEVSNLDKPARPDGIDEDLYDLAYNSAIRSLSISDKPISAAELDTHIKDNLARIVTAQAVAVIADHEGIGKEEGKPELDKLDDVYEKIAGAKNLDEALEKYYGKDNPKIKEIKDNVDFNNSVGALITLDEANRNETWVSALEAKNPNTKATVKDKDGKNVEVTIKEQAKKFKENIAKLKDNKYMKVAAQIGLSVSASAIGMGKAYRVIKGTNYIAQQAKEKGVSVIDLLKDKQNRQDLMKSPAVIAMFPGGRYINAGKTVQKMFSAENKNTFKKIKQIFTGKTPEEKNEGWKSLKKSALITVGTAVAVTGVVMGIDHALEDVEIDTLSTDGMESGQWQEDMKELNDKMMFNSQENGLEDINTPPTAEQEELSEGWSVKGEYANDDATEVQELSPEEAALQADIARLPGQLNSNILTPGGLAELKGSMSPEEYKLSLAMLYPKEGCDQLGIEFKNSSQLMSMYNNGELSEEQKVALMRYAESRFDDNGHPLTAEGNIDTASQEQWKAEELARNEAKLAAEKDTTSRAMDPLPKVDSSNIEDMVAEKDTSGLNIKASQNYSPAEESNTPSEEAKAQVETEVPVHETSSGLKYSIEAREGGYRLVINGNVEMDQDIKDHLTNVAKANDSDGNLDFHQYIKVNDEAIKLSAHDTVYRDLETRALNGEELNSAEKTFMEDHEAEREAHAVKETYRNGELKSKTDYQGNEATFYRDGSLKSFTGNDDVTHNYDRDGNLINRDGAETARVKADVKIDDKPLTELNIKASQDYSPTTSESALEDTKGSIAKGAVARRELPTNEDGVVQHVSLKDKIQEMRGLGNEGSGSTVKATTLSKEIIESRFSNLSK